MYYTEWRCVDAHILASASTSLPPLSASLPSKFQDFPRTLHLVFQDFPGPENFTKIFQDFPGGIFFVSEMTYYVSSGTLNLTKPKPIQEA